MVGYGYPYNQYRLSHSPIYQWCFWLIINVDTTVVWWEHSKKKNGFSFIQMKVLKVKWWRISVHTEFFKEFLRHLLAFVCISLLKYFPCVSLFGSDCRLILVSIPGSKTCAMLLEIGCYYLLLGYKSNNLLSETCLSTKMWQTFYELIQPSFCQVSISKYWTKTQTRPLRKCELSFSFAPWTLDI